MLERFNEIIDCDCTSVKDFRMEDGVGGCPDMLVVKDLHTKYLHTYLVKDQGADNAFQSLQQLLGGTRAKRAQSAMHSDVAPALAGACRLLGKVRDPAEPGELRTNAIAERVIHDILDATRALLFQVGFQVACSLLWLLLIVFRFQLTGSYFVILNSSFLVCFC